MSRRRCRRVVDASGCGFVRDSLQSTTSARRAARLFSRVRKVRRRRVGDASDRLVRDSLQPSTSAGQAARLLLDVGTWCCRRIRDAAVVGSSDTAYGTRLLRAFRLVLRMILERLL